MPFPLLFIPNDRAQFFQFLFVCFVLLFKCLHLLFNLIRIDQSAFWAFLCFFVLFLCLLQNTFGLVNLDAIFEDALIFPLDGLSPLLLKLAFDVTGIDFPFLVLTRALMGRYFAGIYNVSVMVGLVLQV